MKAREAIRLMKADGWYEVLPRSSGSHRQFKHPIKKGKTTVPDHKGKDIPMPTLKSIEKQSDLKLC